MNVEQPDGTVKTLEGNEAIEAFKKHPGPCTLNVGPSLRKKFVQRHRGEGIAAMIERLQGRRWI
jgi:hypothetical protein